MLRHLFITTACLTAWVSAAELPHNEDVSIIEHARMSLNNGYTQVYTDFCATDLPRIEEEYYNEFIIYLQEQMDTTFSLAFADCDDMNTLTNVEWLRSLTRLRLNHEVICMNHDLLNYINRRFISQLYDNPIIRQHMSVVTQFSFPLIKSNVNARLHTFIETLSPTDYLFADETIVPSPEESGE